MTSEKAMYVATGNYLLNNINWSIFKASNNRYYFVFKNAEEQTAFYFKTSHIRPFQLDVQFALIYLVALEIFFGQLLSLLPLHSLSTNN